MNEHYLADYHIHSCWSKDAKATMPEMAASALEHGMNELCFTDHVDIMGNKSMEYNTFDWASYEAMHDEVRRELGGRIVLRRGIELGDAPRDFAFAERVLREMPPVDFIIGSIHQLSAAYEYDDMYWCAAHDEEEGRRQIADYFTLVRKLAAWGKFNVLGHLTLPLRYMNMKNGLHMTFDGFEDEVEEVFRLLVGSGCGIELNTTRGKMPLPEEKWLRLYRALGGELVTLGSDAHQAQHAGLGIEEGQELLRSCGFRYFATFEEQKPIYHKL